MTQDMDNMRIQLEQQKSVLNGNGNNGGGGKKNKKNKKNNNNNNNSSNAGIDPESRLNLLSGVSILPVPGKPGIITISNNQMRPPFGAPPMGQFSQTPAYYDPCCGTSQFDNVIKMPNTDKANSKNNSKNKVPTKSALESKGNAKASKITDNGKNLKNKNIVDKPQAKEIVTKPTGKENKKEAANKTVGKDNKNKNSQTSRKDSKDSKIEDGKNNKKNGKKVLPKVKDFEELTTEEKIQSVLDGVHETEKLSHRQRKKYNQILAEREAVKRAAEQVPESEESEEEEDDYDDSDNDLMDQIYNLNIGKKFKNVNLCVDGMTISCNKDGDLSDAEIVVPNNKKVPVNTTVNTKNNKEKTDKSSSTKKTSVVKKENVEKPSKVKTSKKKITAADIRKLVHEDQKRKQSEKERSSALERNKSKESKKNGEKKRTDSIGGISLSSDSTNGTNKQQNVSSSNTKPSNTNKQNTLPIDNSVKPKPKESKPKVHKPETHIESEVTLNAVYKQPPFHLPLPKPYLAKNDSVAKLDEFDEPDLSYRTFTKPVVPKLAQNMPFLRTNNNSSVGLLKAPIAPHLPPPTPLADIITEMPPSLMKQQQSSIPAPSPPKLTHQQFPHLSHKTAKLQGNVPAPSSKIAPPQQPPKVHQMSPPKPLHCEQNLPQQIQPKPLLSLPKQVLQPPCPLPKQVVQPTCSPIIQPPSCSPVMQPACSPSNRAPGSQKSPRPLSDNGSEGSDRLSHQHHQMSAEQIREQQRKAATEEFVQKSLEKPPPLMGDGSLSYLSNSNYLIGSSANYSNYNFGGLSNSTSNSSGFGGFNNTGFESTGSGSNRNQFGSIGTRYNGNHMPVSATKYSSNNPSSFMHNNYPAPTNFGNVQSGYNVPNSVNHNQMGNMLNYNHLGGDFSSQSVGSNSLTGRPTTNQLVGSSQLIGSSTNQGFALMDQSPSANNMNFRPNPNVGIIGKKLGKGTRIEEEERGVLGGPMNDQQHIDHMNNYYIKY